MIIIFWRGLGILVPIVWFIIFLLTMFIGNNIGGTEQVKPNTRLFAASGSVLAGLLILAIGYLLNRNIKNFDEKHAFFFIPVEYCGIAIVVVTILIAVFVR